MKTDVVIVGGGLCGLILARILTEAGLSAKVFDKASRPGGRLATRKTSDETVDTGPQSLCFDSPEALAAVQRYAPGELAPISGDGSYSYGFRTSSAALSGALRQGVDYRTGLVTHLARKSDDTFTPALWGHPASFDADAVALTPPAPQVVNLLRASHLEVPRWLSRIDYEKRLVLVSEAITSDQPKGGSSKVFEYWGNTQPGSQSWVAFASAEWSENHWGQDQIATESEMLREVVRLFPERRTSTAQVKRWRYANAIDPEESMRSYRLSGLPIWIAGDGYGAPTSPAFGAQRSVLSAISTAESILTSLQTDR
ncbi:NAD(P)-binding protein [Candidatus Nanopelagicales bacterium]|nr:NAD(P)-binding protein [Candidatus Nanopelagicales bacterium]